MLEQVRTIMADVFKTPLETIVPDSAPETVESWDSLNHLELVLALEQAFGTQFTPEEIETLLSPEIIANILDEKLRKERVA